MATAVEVIAALVVIAGAVIGQIHTYRSKSPNRILVIVNVAAVIYLFVVPKSSDIRDVAFAGVGLALLLVPLLMFEREIEKARRKRESEGETERRADGQQ